MALPCGVKQDQSLRTVENACTSTCYRISPTQNFSSRLRRTPEGQHKPLKPLGLWDPPDRFEDEYRNEKQCLGCDVDPQDDSFVRVRGLQVLAADSPNALEVSRVDKLILLLPS